MMGSIQDRIERPIVTTPSKCDKQNVVTNSVSCKAVEHGVVLCGVGGAHLPAGLNHPATGPTI